MQFAAGWGDGAATSNSVRVERLSPHLVSHFAGAHVSRSSPSREDKKEEILMPTEKFQFEGEGGHHLAAALEHRLYLKPVIEARAVAIGAPSPKKLSRKLPVKSSAHALLLL